MSEWHLTDFTAVDVTVKREASGGFGDVYMGPDYRFHQGRWFALKTLHPRYLATERGKRLFLNECLTWVGLWPHPNLLTAHIVTQINGQLFLLLDYAEEGNLRDLFQDYAAYNRGEPLPIGTALLLAMQIAAGLVALHTPDPAFLRPQPIVHRDLKPENILLDQEYYAKITDFGLAKVIAELDTAEDMGSEADADDTRDTHAGDTHDFHAATATASRRYRTQRGVAMGTLPYMPPEQWVDSASAGPPADMYAFGIILSELFTGTHPLLPWERSRFASEDQWRLAHFQATPSSLVAARTLARHTAGATEAEPPLPAELEALFQRLLAKHASDRPKADETLVVLQQFAVARGEKPHIPSQIMSHTTDSEWKFWDRWAISYIRFGMYQEALERNDQALALAPTNGKVLLTRANVLALIGRLEEALDCYDRALGGLQASDTHSQAVVWDQRAIQLRIAGRYLEAEAAHVQAVTLAPGDPRYWHNRAKNEWKWGLSLSAEGEHTAEVQHWRQGLGYVEEALRLTPNDPRSIELRHVLHQLLNSGAFPLEE